MHAAVCNQHEHLVKWLIANGANINAGDLYQPVCNSVVIIILLTNQINWAMKQAREKEFSHNINPNLDCRGWTPLHYVCHAIQT